MGTQVLLFLLEAVASFMATLFLLRFLMQAFRVSFAGPLGHFVIQLTRWAVTPLRRWVPGVGGYDWSSLLAAFVVELLLAVLVLGLTLPPAAALDGGSAFLLVTGFALRHLLRLLVHILVAALIVQAVLSWVSSHSPLVGTAQQFTRPLLDPIRRFMPMVAGIDLSPLVAILLLQVVLMFL